LAVLFGQVHAAPGCRVTMLLVGRTQARQLTRDCSHAHLHAREDADLEVCLELLSKPLRLGDERSDSLARLPGGLVVLSLSSSASLDTPDLSAALRHSLAHLAFDEALGGGDVPAWFHEGYAAHVARADSAIRIQ